MSDHLLAGAQPRPGPPSPTSELFAWNGGGIVLLAERVGTNWILARGWRQGDRLSDVRRWSFADRRAFVGQVRRLVREATGDTPGAGAVASAALAWAERMDR